MIQSVQSTMRVRLPFSFSHTYFNVGGLKPSTRVCHDWVEGEVPEIEMAEAPVALRWLQNAPGRSGRKPMSVRYWQGRFFKCVQIATTNGEFKTLASSLLVDPNGPHDICSLMADDYSSRSLSSVNAAFAGRANPKPPLAGNVELDLGTDEERKRMEADRKVGGLLVIEGEIWSEIDEPVLFNRAEDPSIAWPKIRRGIGLWSPTFGNFGAPPNAMAYRIGDTEAWIGYREPRDREALQLEAHEIEVLIQEAFVFDQERNAMRRAVETFLELLGPDAWRWDADRASLFRSVRDAFRTHLASPGEYPVEDILQILPAFLADLQPLHVRYRDAFTAVKFAGSLEPTVHVPFSCPFG